MKTQPVVAFFCIFTVFILACVSYFPMTADDAYIVGRYAYNLQHHGVLAYNIEDPVSALTSPLHALVEGTAALAFNLEPVLTWKYFSVLLLICSVAILCAMLQGPKKKAALCIFTLMCPSVLVWTVGGLETILLMFLLVAGTGIFLRRGITDQATLLSLGTIFGLAFLTRFDSAVYMTPICLYIVFSCRHSGRQMLLFLLPPVLMITAWFSFSKLYYGHFLPTSFYQKTPGASGTHVSATLTGLLWTGVLPLATYLLISGKIHLSNVECSQKEKHKFIAVMVSLCFLIAYLFTMAGSHMMFSFRAFLPYLPIVFFLLLFFSRDISRSAITIAFILQTVLIYTTYNYGLNYPLPKQLLNWLPSRYFYGEFSDTNAPTAIKIHNIWAYQAGAIAEDWEKRGSPRKAVVFANAEGIAAYNLPDMYFTGLLVTRGRCITPDYIMAYGATIHLEDREAPEKAITWALIDLKQSMNRPKKLLTVFRFEDLDPAQSKAVLKRIEKCNSQTIY